MKKDYHHYSGDDSKEFWARVNSLGERQNELYSLGVMLQRTEEYVLRILKIAEVEDQEPDDSYCCPVCGERYACYCPQEPESDHSFYCEYHEVENDTCPFSKTICPFSDMREGHVYIRKPYPCGWAVAMACEPEDQETEG